MIAVSEPKTHAIVTFDDIRGPVEPHLEALNTFLDQQLASFEPETREMAAYCLRHQGKRLRPLLVWYAGFAKQPEKSAFDRAIRAAAIVELVHQATLVHDDILDDATIRHNSDTPWEKYGAASAVLLGDALFAQALHLAAGYDTVMVCREVSLATRRVCSGEISQTFHRGNGGQTFEHYFRVIDLKTAELFRVSCLLGAHLAGYPDTIAQAAAAFGRHLGVAYQIFDDLADYAGDEVKIGKTLGTDLASGKLTLPVLHLLDRLPDNEAHQLQKRMFAGELDKSELLPLLEAHGCLQRSTDRFHHELDQADAALIPIWDAYPPAQMLQQLSRFIRQQIQRLPLSNSV